MEDEIKEIEEIEKPSEIEEDGVVSEEITTDEPNEASVEAETITETDEVAPNEMSTQEETTTEESFIPGVATSDDGFENNYTTPMDFSWLDEKAKDVSTMTAEAGISTELNNPLEHEKTKQETLQKDVEKTAEEEAAKKAQIFNENQLKQIEEFDPNSGVWLTKLGNILSFGIAPKVNEVPNFDKEAYKSFIESKAKESGNADKAIRDVNSLIEKSQLGLAKEGIEYWAATGDTLGNKYAIEAENTVASALLAFNDGKITDAELEAILDGVVNPSNSEQLKSLFTSPALKGLEVYGIGALGGAAIGKGLSVAAEKITPKIVDKLIQTSMSNSKAAGAAEKVLKMLSSSSKVRAELSNSKKFDVYKKFMEKDLSGDFYKTDIGKKFVDTYGKMLANQINEAVKIADRGDDILRIKDVRVVTDAIQKGIITGEDLIKAVAAANNISEDTAKKVAAASGITIGAVKGAEAAPTGIFDKSGKMIDSKEIVKERQENPYTGEDKVVLQSREGSVTVDPREAVIIGESESLTPTQGYTEEVKKLAQEEKREVYEKEPVEMVQPTQHDLSVFDKAVDYVQAILGGRDLNNDKTITNSEWYQSTIGPVVESMKETFSLPDLKSVAKDVGNKVERFVDRVGGNLAASIPGVINLSTGEIQVVDREVPATEDMAKLLQTKVVDSLPSWGDDAQSDAMKSVVANTVMENIAPMYGNVGVITLVKAAGTYATETIAEICHLNDYELSNDQKGMINFAITNAIGLSFEPVSTIIRDVTSGYGILQRGKIEATLSGETPTKSDTVYIVPYDGSNEVDSQYGIGKEKIDADTQYSGYREQAKESNVATDYNRGLEKNVNTAVSDKIVKVFNSEPDYIKNAIRKILISYKELH